MPNKLVEIGALGSRGLNDVRYLMSRISATLSVPMHFKAINSKPDSRHAIRALENNEKTKIK